MTSRGGGSRRRGACQSWGVFVRELARNGGWKTDKKTQEIKIKRNKLSHSQFHSHSCCRFVLLDCLPLLFLCWFFLHLFTYFPSKPCPWIVNILRVSGPAARECCEKRGQWREQNDVRSHRWLWKRYCFFQSAAALDITSRIRSESVPDKW